MLRKTNPRRRKLHRSRKLGRPHGKPLSKGTTSPPRSPRAHQIEKPTSKKWRTIKCYYYSILRWPGLGKRLGLWPAKLAGCGDSFTEAESVVGWRLSATKLPEKPESRWHWPQALGKDFLGCRTRRDHVTLTRRSRRRFRRKMVRLAAEFESGEFDQLQARASSRPGPRLCSRSRGRRRPNLGNSGVLS